MVESIYLIVGVFMGVIITLVGFKIGSKAYRDAVTDITQPPDFRDEDRTQTTQTPYDYNQYEEHYDTLRDEPEAKG